MNAGYYEEAQAWRDWLLRAVAGSPDAVQIMYGLAGERRLTEWELPWLPGYESSAPVRIGNAAARPAPARRLRRGDGRACTRRGAAASPSNELGWALQRALLDHLETIWRQPDEGIWEVRGAPQHFTHSKVMAWVALRPRGQERRRRSGCDGPVDAGASVRDAIHDEVCANGFDPELRQLRAVLRLASSSTRACC